MKNVVKKIDKKLMKKILKLKKKTRQMLNVIEIVTFDKR